MTLWLSLAGAGLALLVASALWWRRDFLRGRPLALWGHEHGGPHAAAEHAAALVGLRAEEGPPNLDWLLDYLLLSVWFFWGDLRTRRPARQLRRWRLRGELHDRDASVRFDDGAALLTLTGHATPLWAVPPRERAFVDQEGLRPLLPVGSPRWIDGIGHLSALFALGATRVAVEDGALTATLVETPPEKWPAAYDELSALLQLIE
jgi:hypothetical protein